MSLSEDLYVTGRGGCSRKLWNSGPFHILLLTDHGVDGFVLLCITIMKCFMVTGLRAVGLWGRTSKIRSESFSLCESFLLLLEI